MSRKTAEAPTTESPAREGPGTITNLQQALALQEARIKILESQLEELQPEPGPSSSITPLRGRPRLINHMRAAKGSRPTRLLVTQQDNQNFKLPLSGKRITIGREPANDIQVRSRFVSRFHARIVNDADGAFIEDLDSRNGIKVNMEPVSKRRLRSGDYIKIGRMQLQYLDISAAPEGHGRA